MKRLLPLLLLLAFCWPHDKAHATACTGGCIQYGNASTFSGTTITTTLTGVTAGNDIRVYYVVAPNTSTATVTVGGSAATACTTINQTVTYTVGCAYFPNVGSGSKAVVVTSSATCTQCTVLAEEWAGDITSGTLDGQNAASVTSGTLAAGSVTTSGSNDSFELFLYTTNGVAPTAVPTGFAFAANTGTGVGLYSSFQNSVTAGTYNPSYTRTAGMNNNWLVGAAFKQSGGGGPTCPLTRATTGVGC